MPLYYNYNDHNAGAVNHPDVGTWENTDDWPRAFTYSSNTSAPQGVHPPAPVYQAAQQPAQSATYYYSPAQASATAPAGYYYTNGTYYGAQAPAATYGWPSTYPAQSYTCYPISQPATQTYTYPSYAYSHYRAAPAPSVFQTTATAQAAAAAAANAALAAQPAAPAYYVGYTPADFAAQQAFITMSQKPMPTQLAPYKPANGQQFWCKELDGSWTLQSYTDILNGAVNPGRWEKHATSGYYYWVRQ